MMTEERLVLPPFFPRSSAECKKVAEAFFTAFTEKSFFSGDKVSIYI